MNTPRNKTPRHQTVEPSPKPQAISSRPHQPNVAQPKNAVAAQNINRHAAPTPLAKRQVTPPAARPQEANPSRQIAGTVASPAHYQPVVKALQAKMLAPQQPANRPGRVPTAPPAYRPQSVPKVLQTKAAGAQPRRTVVSPPAIARPGTPPVRPAVPTRSEPGRAVQRMKSFVTNVGGFAYKRSTTFVQIYSKLPTDKQLLVDQAIKEITEPTSVNTFQPAEYKWKEYYFRKVGNNEGFIGWEEQESEKVFKFIEEASAASKLDKL